MTKRRPILWVLLFALCAPLPCVAAPVQGQPVRIGSIDLGSKLSEYAQPYENAVSMAVAEINAEGGINGRPLEVLFRDSKLDPGEAVRLADELLTRDKVLALINCDSTVATLAVSSWAKRNKIPFIETMNEADSIIGEHGHPYVFRAFYGGEMQMRALLKLAQDRYGDKIKGKRWAIIAPNYEYGRSLVAATKRVAAERGLAPLWVAEQWPAFDKLAAGASIAALEHAKPDIVLSFLCANDLTQFVREGKKRAFFKDRIVIAPPAALPEHLTALGAELPSGWISLGFPIEDITDPGFVRFRESYQKAYRALPTVTAIYGYNATYALAAALKKANADDPEKIRSALEDVSFPTPGGEEHFRTSDHQASTFFWVGVTAVEKGRGKIIDWRMENTDAYPPSAAQIEALRKEEKETLP